MGAALSESMLCPARMKGASLTWALPRACKGEGPSSALANLKTVGEARLAPSGTAGRAARGGCRGHKSEVKGRRAGGRLHSSWSLMRGEAQPIPAASPSLKSVQPLVGA